MRSASVCRFLYGRGSMCWILRPTSPTHGLCLAQSWMSLLESSDGRTPSSAKLHQNLLSGLKQKPSPAVSGTWAEDRYDVNTAEKNSPPRTCTYTADTAPASCSCLGMM
jgi:hypothetical protein